MKIAVGAPVAERAWILPEWYACLRRQTIKFDHLCFVYSDSKDLTWSALEYHNTRAELHRIKIKEPFYHRNDRGGNPKDPHRAQHFADLRNRLRRLFLTTDADVFVSLDTDVLLEDPTILEQLVGNVVAGWDVMSALIFLSPQANSGCYNAGYLGGGDLGAFDQQWARADENMIRAHRTPLRIDIPMACYAIKRHMLAMCGYRAHECGEDVGFGQSLSQHHAKVGWRTDLEARHVWGPEYLRGSTECNAEAVAQS